MTKPSQLKIEKAYFERFMRKYEGLPKGSVLYTNNPDVIICGNKKTGIEITNFYLEDGRLLESEQRQRVIRDDVIKAAQDHYFRQDRKKVELSFGFDKSKPIFDKNLLINKIIDLVKHLDDSKSGQVDKNIYSNIDEIDFVYVNSEEYDDVRWRVIQVYDVPIMSKENLVDIIRKKEGSSSTYQSCDSLWLLIVVDFADPAQDQEINIEGLEDINNNVFEKVIIYKTIFDQTIVLGGASSSFLR